MPKFNVGDFHPLSCGCEDCTLRDYIDSTFVAAEKEGEEE